MSLSKKVCSGCGSNFIPRKEGQDRCGSRFCSPALAMNDHKVEL